MIMTIVLLIIGVMLLIGGAFFLVKEKSDRESRNIYLITLAIGVILIIATSLKLLL